MINPKVFIGIPAHNEEKNIEKLLRRINSQNVEGFDVKKIVVVCDGCTDSTENVVRNLKNDIPNLEILNDGKRVGQAKRLQELYLLASEQDIFITFDADTFLKDGQVLQNLVKEFQDDDDVLVGANAFAVGKTNFFSKCILAHESFWKHLTLSLNNGNNIHTHLGCASAARVSYLKTLSFPEDLTASDHFLFLKTIENGKKYKLAKTAVVFFKVSSRFSDYKAQQVRYFTSEQALEELFSKEVLKAYDLPLQSKIKSYIVSFFDSPVCLVGALIIQLYLRNKMAKGEKYSSAVWETIKSTKEMSL